MDSHRQSEDGLRSYAFPPHKTEKDPGQKCGALQATGVVSTHCQPDNACDYLEGTPLRLLGRLMWLRLTEKGRPTLTATQMRKSVKGTRDAQCSEHQLLFQDPGLFPSIRMVAHRHPNSSPKKTTSPGLHCIPCSPRTHMEPSPLCDAV